ncbi:hypothetical protein BIV57_17460 [Mangrovactinospora gilvigrisea]|uniref:Maleylpyruvate isomerase family mycothiol-dependent enzyme n=1 Tax=Mangrovactinospora gilvigrisea TaxID=1428644 RepID=A0A1J7C9A8_9ACTN|nr:maleylpyruvate isomerase family mycothiol-dependent enzyme [Mangrovactinospora gilvigrisea]OIV36218.1 hypothetical protein BIV57_17460 [Mangrovactinospora gilvigrisea]
MDVQRRTHRGSRLEPSRHLELLRQDGELLADSAVATPVAAESSVPGCPGWTVHDVVRHTGSVHRRVIGWVRDGARPAEWERCPPAGHDLVSWYREGLDALARELASHDPSKPAATWYPGDRTMAFWYRRMACETAVHRVDVQGAVRDADDPDPVDNGLALDAVDEVLTVFLGGPRDAEHPLDRHYLDGRAVVVAAGDFAWRVEFGPDGVRVRGGSRDGGDLDGSPLGAPVGGNAEVAGDPSRVLLWLWGRLPGSAVQLRGDPGVLVAFRKRLAADTR